MVGVLFQELGDDYQGSVGYFDRRRRTMTKHMSRRHRHPHKYRDDDETGGGGSVVSQQLLTGVNFWCYDRRSRALQFADKAIPALERRNISSGDRI